MKLRTVTALTATCVLALTACGAAPGASSTAASPGVNRSAPLYKSLPESVRKAGKLVVGSQLASPPIAFLAEDAKTVKGVNKDLADQLSKQLGVPVQFSQYAFPGLQPALTSKKIDAVFDLMDDTPTRQQTFDFVDFIVDGFTILVKDGNPAGVNSIADLCGKTVSIVTGSTAIPVVEAQSGKCTAEGKQTLTVKQFQKASDARLQVQSGKMTAFFGATPVMLYLADNAEGGKAFDAVQGEIYGKTVAGMAVRKDDTALRDSLVKAYSAIMEDGSYTQVLAKYGLQDLALDKPTVNGGK